MKKEREEEVGIGGLTAFVIVIIATTLSVAMSGIYFSEYGIQTPENGILNGSYSSPIWNTTETYNLSIGEQYISDKLDFFFFIMVAGFLGITLWSMINFVNKIGETEWDDLRHNVGKICFILKYAAGIIAWSPALVYFGYQINIMFIMAYMIYIFVACVIIEMLYDVFIYKGV